MTDPYTSNIDFQNMADNANNILTKINASPEESLYKKVFKS